MESEQLPESQPLKKLLLENREGEVTSISQEKFTSPNENENSNKIEKPNKAMTPYIAFVKDYKDKHGVSLSFKELGGIWRDLSVEEKQKYVQIADEDLKRYKMENAKYLESISQNPQNENEEQKEILYNDDVGTSFPISRIKNMLKTDEDNKVIKKNVLLYLEQATELFGEYILKEIISNVKTKKKKLETSDLCDAIKKNKKLTFLRSTGILDIQNEKPSKIKLFKEKEKEKTIKPVENVQKMPVSNNKKIEDYFKKIK